MSDSIDDLGNGNLLADSIEGRAAQFDALLALAGGGEEGLRTLTAAAMVIAAAKRDRLTRDNPFRRYLSMRHGILIRRRDSNPETTP